MIGEIQTDSADLIANRFMMSFVKPHGGLLRFSFWHFKPFFSLGVSSGDIFLLARVTVSRFQVRTRRRMCSILAGPHSPTVRRTPLHMSMLT
jgi:hypothetical protein